VRGATAKTAKISNCFCNKCTTFPVSPPNRHLSCPNRATCS